jgi:hypothetical protein
MTKDLNALIEDLRLNHEYCPKEIILKAADELERLSTTLKQEHGEPVATVISESGANVTHSWWHEPALPIGTKLYTSPQRTWVGLTYEEESELIRLAHNHAGIRFYIQAAEAKLKEKNT